MNINLQVTFFIVLQVFNLAVGLDEKAVSAISNFAFDFCDELYTDKSAISSPLSAEFVLSLLSLGATGTARSELLSTLGFANDDTTRSTFAELSSEAEDVKGVTLNIANKVYIGDGNYDVDPELKNDAINYFDADMEKVNFNNGATAAETINDWVANKTNDKIQQLFTPGSFNSDTRVVLVNAIYFKGMWKNQFDPKDTSEQPFYVKPDKTINVPMMYKESKYKYGESESLDAKLLELLYVGDDVKMVIVLPNKIDGLDCVLEKLADGHNFTDELENMYSTKVQVSVPKFKIETEIDLKPLLQKLGIKAIFDQGNSGLTKLLDNNEPLYVSKAVQKAFIEVNEAGAEAAAATGIAVVALSSIARPPLQFIADRPFLFMIVIPQNVITFIGTYSG